MLSIVYITCNRSEELEKSILSCAKAVSIEHEFVIVDNGSADSTQKMIEALIDKGLPIKYLYQNANHGVAGGRNIGFEAALGDICYFIDDDATIISEGLVLDAAYEYIKKDPSIFAMGTDCFDVERNIQLIGLHEKGATPNSECSLLSYLGGSHFIKKDSITTPFLYPHNLMYGSEEAYLGRTVYRSGGRIAQYPYLKILHSPSVNTRSSTVERRRNGHINIYVIKRYFLVFPYNIISAIAFFLRIARFEKFSLKQINADIKMASKRYDTKYEQKMSIAQIQKLIKRFKAKIIL